MAGLSQAEAEVRVLSIPAVGLDTKGPLDGSSAMWRRVSSSGRTGAWLRVALREPLAHFMLAGAALLALSSLFGHSNAGSAQSRIQVSAAEIDRLREIWIRQWGHPPDAKQIDNLVQDCVREEVYYREALASGLDKDDTIIRRRLVEKMEFLSQEIASGEPSDADLQQFFKTNRQKYSLPAEAGFTHIYFSTSRRGAAAFQDARAALARLESNGINSGEATQLGDTFMLQAEYPPQTRDQIRNLFGDEFAAKVVDLAPGTWAGPIRSTYGWHLVLVKEHVAPRQPTLDEVRNQVAIDYKNQRLQTSSDNYYARLRQRYRLEIDQNALAAAKAKASQPGEAQPAKNKDDGTPPDLD
jgi:peptidyl-prolyl cis-trans isomerase C